MDLIDDKMTDREKEIIVCLNKHEAAGEGDQSVNNAAEELGLGTQRVYNVRKKYDKLAQQPNIIREVTTEEEAAKMLQDMNFQSNERLQIINRFKESVDWLEKRRREMDETFTEIKGLLETIHINEEDQNWKTWRAMLKLMTGATSPLQFVNILAEERKTLMSVDSIMNSQNSSLQRMMLIMNTYLEADISRLPPDKQLKAVKWLEGNYCPDCAGFPKKLKQRRDKERGMENIYDDTEKVVDVEAEEVDEKVEYSDEETEAEYHGTEPLQLD
jgi:hypothetical protein